MSPSDEEKMKSAHQRWAEFRFGVVGGLLSSPPPKGNLEGELDQLCQKTWQHPTQGRPTRFGKSTIERWFHQARAQEEKSPVDVLRRRVRQDAGTYPGVTDAVKVILRAQHERYPYWSYRLHYDNVKAALEGTRGQGTAPSYSTLRCYMKHADMRKRRKPRRRDDGTELPGSALASERLEKREVRSYEREFVGALWHLDFHACSRKVLLENGSYVTPMALGIIDDHSRLLCHIQWYLGETTEDLVHGLTQAILRRGLPRALMTDNGSAMKGEELVEGLMRLGVVHDMTLPYSPYQNGKQESFWGRLEGRLVAMLGRCDQLTLKRLNDLTFAWAEYEYNTIRHEETGQVPADRYVKSPRVLRSSPDTQTLRAAFRMEETRTQRRSDGTVSIQGRRFEVPSQYRHFERLRVRYARWDLSYVTFTEKRTGIDLGRLYPQDKAKNASGIRRGLDPVAPDLPATPDLKADESDIPPLLEKLLKKQEESGFAPAYLPKPSEESQIAADTNQNSNEKS
jgi:transposase InsO family protein